MHEALRFIQGTKCSVDQVSQHPREPAQQNHSNPHICVPTICFPTKLSGGYSSKYANMDHLWGYFIVTDLLALPVRRSMPLALLLVAGTFLAFFSFRFSWPTTEQQFEVTSHGQKWPLNNKDLQLLYKLSIIVASS